jgi:hypothetical protein
LIKFDRDSPWSQYKLEQQSFETLTAYANFTPRTNASCDAALSLPVHCQDVPSSPPICNCDHLYRSSVPPVSTSDRVHTNPDRAVHQERYNDRNPRHYEVVPVRSRSPCTHWPPAPSALESELYHAFIEHALVLGLVGLVGYGGYQVFRCRKAAWKWVSGQIQPFSDIIPRVRAMQPAEMLLSISDNLSMLNGLYGFLQTRLQLAFKATSLERWEPFLTMTMRKVGDALNWQDVSERVGAIYRGI